MNTFRLPSTSFFDIQDQQSLHLSSVSFEQCAAAAAAAAALSLDRSQMAVRRPVGFLVLQRKS